MQYSGFTAESLPKYCSKQSHTVYYDNISYLSLFACLCRYHQFTLQRWDYAQNDRTQQVTHRCHFSPGALQVFQPRTNEFQIFAPRPSWSVPSPAPGQLVLPHSWAGPCFLDPFHLPPSFWWSASSRRGNLNTADWGLPRFRSESHHSLAVWPWELTSPWLSFSTCKTEIIPSNSYCYSQVKRSTKYHINVSSINDSREGYLRGHIFRAFWDLSESIFSLYSHFISSLERTITELKTIFLAVTQVLFHGLSLSFQDS